MTELEKNQANCPYCHNEPIQADLVQIDNNVVIAYLESNTLVLETIGCKTAKVIAYCPMCGRKLGDEE